MNVIAGALAGVFATLYGLYANILGTLTGAILGMVVSFFNFVSSERFISISYTNAGLTPSDPNFNPFVHLGWTLTRDLTNIFFVLALVIIGLATALGIQGYQAKKALPVLIGVALLINFTPVILGLVVDAANIVMNFFMQGGFAGGNSFANYATSQWSNIGSLVGGLKFWDPTSSNEAMAAAVGSFVLIFFNLISALIYLIFTLLFVIRYVAIWTLVIVSPFAFACYILPATRSVFGQWWKQFIQWSLIGAIAAFFLYLADHFIRIANTEDFMAASMDEIAGAPGLAPILNSTLPYFVAIIFLFIGLFASLAFAPKGADAIIKGGQKGINRASRLMLKRNWKDTKSAFKYAVKTPGRSARMYQASQRAGLSKRRSALEAFRRTAPGSRMLRRYGKRYKATREDKFTSGWQEALGKATIKEAKGATKGLRRAVKDVWGTAIGKKGKTWTCRACGATDIPIDKKACPNCGNQRGGRQIQRRARPPTPRTPGIPSAAPPEDPTARERRRQREMREGHRSFDYSEGQQPSQQTPQPPQKEPKSVRKLRKRAEKKGLPPE